VPQMAKTMGSLEETFEPASFFDLMQQLNMSNRFSGGGRSSVEFRQLSGSRGSKSVSRRSGSRGSRGSMRQATPEAEAMMILDRHPFRPSPATGGAPASLSRLISRALASGTKAKNAGSPEPAALPRAPAAAAERRVERSQYKPSAATDGAGARAGMPLHKMRGLTLDVPRMEEQAPIATHLQPVESDDR
jgi:hypothetical protein